MSELKIKHRRGELTLTENDVILFNQACYQLITQTYRDGWSRPYYVLSKTVCEKLIKQGKLKRTDAIGSTKDKPFLQYFIIS